MFTRVSANNSAGANNNNNNNNNINNNNNNNNNGSNNTSRKSNTYRSSSTSVQFINIVNKNTDTSKNNDKTPQVSFGKDGKKHSISAPIHRNSIGRRTLKYTVRKIGCIDRFYYMDQNEFQLDLDFFNANINFLKDDQTHDSKSKTNFICVGLANTRLKFCSICFDVDKNNEVELYYVDKADISQHRTILCRGCIGSMLKKTSSRRESSGSDS